MTVRIVGTLRLPGTAACAGRARRYARRLVGSVAEVDDLDDVELCVDELFANAVEHTASGRGGRVSVVVSLHGGAVRVTVVDDGGSPTKPFVRRDSYDEGGRGLWLVERLSRRWGSDPAEHGGNAVWAEFNNEVGGAA